MYCANCRIEDYGLFIYYFTFWQDDIVFWRCENNTINQKSLIFFDKKYEFDKYNLDISSKLILNSILKYISLI